MNSAVSALPPLDDFPTSFPAFSLERLLTTVFQPKKGESVAILIDLEDPSQMKDFSFLKDETLHIQKNAYEFFHQELQKNVMSSLGLTGGEMFAYKITGGSNLDLPDTAVNEKGETVSLKDAVYTQYDLVLCISTYSATAPLTAFAKELNFRGATLHGLNSVILQSGLCVDYDIISAEAEKLRIGMTQADAIEIDYVIGDKTATLRLELNKQEAQKSHGLCRGPEADIANLPAGEIYYVPNGASGQFPFQIEESTMALLTVEDLVVTAGELISGEQSVVDAYIARVKSDPAFGKIGELGFGTQTLPVSGVDIQDEKILGTCHVATGRSDHLGGDITPDQFVKAENATHEDILFAPEKTPNIQIPQVRMYKDDSEKVLLENYKPVYMKELLEA